MSGLVIPLSSKSTNNVTDNIGTVTVLNNTTVTSIKINSESSYTGNSFKPNIECIPEKTAALEVIWSLKESYDNIASINSKTGEVKILTGASNSNITIVAKSIYNSDITDEKVITVTYNETNITVNLTGISISGNDSINNTGTYTVVYTPDNANLKGVAWSITFGSEYATIDSSTGIVTALSAADYSKVTIQATATRYNNITASKDIRVTYDETNVLYNLSTPFQSDGTSTYIDTGVKLYDTVDKSWTIVGYYKIPETFVSTASSDNVQWISCIYDVKPWPGIGIGQTNNNKTYTSDGLSIYYGTGKTYHDNITAVVGKEYLIGITKNVSTYNVYLFDPITVSLTYLLKDTVAEVTTAFNYTVTLDVQTKNDGSLMRYWNGIINRLKIYDTVKTSDEILTKLKAMYNSVNGTSL